MTEQSQTPEKKLRGFAAMDPERQREIASKGGRVAHLRGNAHEFTPEEAREAGRKGGQTVSKDRKHMARIGRLGGEARGHGRSESSEQSTETPRP
jgi:general stress protein YciG